jgi:hypothetical protein
VFAWIGNPGNWTYVVIYAVASATGLLLFTLGIFIYLRAAKVSKRVLQSGEFS